MGKKAFCLFFSSFFFLSQINASAQQAQDPTITWAQGSTVSVNPTSGSASTSFKIDVPQGRAGIQPNLALGYGGSGNDIFGVGWGLEIGSIERSLKFGIPKYDSTDTFILKQSGSSQELVFDSATQQFHPKVENTFAKIQHITAGGDYWVVTDKNGTKYFFGQANASREFDSAQPSRIYSWQLDYVEDVHGNYMKVSYYIDTPNNKIYPDKIEYTGYAPTNLSPYASVVFEREFRPDASFTYKPGFKITTTQRIKRIHVLVGANLQKRYDLNYSLSASTKKSLLASIQPIGSDGTSPLPVTMYEYYNTKGFELASGWSIPSDVVFSQLNAMGINDDVGTRILDINNDGYSDILRYYSFPNTGYTIRKTYLNNHSQGWVDSAEYRLPADISYFIIGGPWLNGATYQRDQSVRFADINGDSKIDIVQSHQNLVGLVPYNLIQNTVLSSGIGWMPTLHAELINFPPPGKLSEQPPPGWQHAWNLPGTTFTNQNDSTYAPSAFAQDWLFAAQPLSIFQGIEFADANADGFIDFIKSTDINEFNSINSSRTFINNYKTGQEGWSLQPSWKPPVSPNTQLVRSLGRVACGTVLIDMNGDRLPDFFHKEANDAVININNSTNWFEDASSAWKNTLGIGNIIDGTTQMVDINGDGLEDLVVAKSSYASGSRTLINTGNGWFEDSEWALPEGEFKNFGTRFLDANGDGMMDFMIHYNGQTPKLYLNKGKPADLLKTVRNGVGGSTTLEYGASTQFTNNFLPQSFPVVTKITQTDQLNGNQYSTQYQYANGLWDAATREFRGFAYVKTIDPEGNYTESDYLQGEYTKGLLKEQRTYDQTGKLFGKAINSWNDSTEIIPGSRFVYLERKDSIVYDGDANLNNGKRTAEQYFYQETPQRGNLTKKIQFGEVNITNGSDIGTDSRTTEISYVNNPAKYVMGLLYQTIIRNHGGAEIRKSWLAYDNTAFGDPTDKGMVTRKKEWGGNAPFDVAPQTSFEYDQYGNLTKTTEPEGISTSSPYDYATSIAYDSVYHVFPVTVTNAQLHTEKTEYYGVNATPDAGYQGLWGQLYSTTDPNLKIGKRTYDVFGRPLKTVGPLDTFSLPSATTDYTITSTYIKITSRQRVKNGDALMIESSQFIDGLGRELQSVSPSADSGKYIISGITKYNSRGLPEKEYESFFSAQPVDFIYNESNVPAGTPFTTNVYDAMGRVKEIRRADNSFSSVIYDKWTTIAIDENGHKQANNFDAYGRLKQKIEYTGADGRAALYPLSGYVPYSTTNYEYDSEGLLTKTIDPHGNETTVIYDKLGRKRQMVDPDMGVWTYSYDVNGNLKKQVDAKGQVINFDYDWSNRLLRKYDDAYTIDVVYTYDADNNGATLNEKGQLVQVDYDQLGMEKINFEFDEIGRELKSIKQINSQSYKVENNYNALDNLTNVVYPDNSKIYYQYNAAGQIQKISNMPLALPSTDVGAPTTSRPPTRAPVRAPTRPPLGSPAPPLISLNSITPNTAQKLTTVTLSGSGFGTYPTGNIYNPDADANKDGKVDQIDLGYLARGWQCRPLDACYTIEADFNKDKYIDVRDLLVMSNAWYGVRPASYVLFGGGVWAKVINWSDTQIQCVVPWEAQSGNVTVITPNGISNGVNFTLSVPAPNQVNFVENVTYFSSGQIDTITFGNGVTTKYTYDERLRLKRILSKNAGAVVLQDLNYTYDPVGNIVHIGDNTPNDHDQSFTYDDLNRLKTATGYYLNNGATQTTKIYSYDEVGNIKQKDGKNYIYGEGPAGPHAVTTVSGFPATTYTYDANGNMVTKQEGSEITFYKYDVENRLVEIKKGTDDPSAKFVAKYRYDGDGGRTRKEVYNNGVLNRITTFVGSLYERTGTKETGYILLGDMRVASMAGGEVMYYLHDHLGGTNQLLDANGVIKEVIEYDPFGSDARHDKYGAPDQAANYYFSNHYKDEESGLIFMQARYYDPQLGRFITPDTIVPYAEDSQSFNRYTYSRNNPVNLVDDDGHWFWGFIIGAIIGGAVAAATDGNILQGIITGAISGAIFGFVGDLGLQGAAQALGHAVGGAASGAINATITGGDPVIGALIGGLSAGATEGLGQANILPALEGSNFFELSGNFVRRAVVGGAIGGVTSSAMGGGFLDGFTQGMYTSAVAMTANHLLHDVQSWVANNIFNADGISKQAEKIQNSNNLIEKGVRSLWVLALTIDGASNIFPGKAAVKTTGLQVIKKVISRKSLGGDAAKSWHIIEKAGDRTISVTHQVEKDGKIIHQHQKHIGVYGGERQFPDEWVEYPDIGVKK